ncbi:MULTISPECIES: polyhydroxyalkanoate synthesis repressor PhaR [Pacificimonas]|uniref:polyhydroxyalkanoate synthesis repressor PhaR n=1 Tax=Pacificimonas TaxID=1960290 RepID=UPI001CCF15B7|nr:MULTISPECIES: polyhydroxyalkanoate synthesis repressor PhaR [Pacificimonas]
MPRRSKQTNGQDDGPTIIKKYANRRLYNTGTSSYITLDTLAQMTREGTEFKVIDAKSGEDITRTVLTQIIMDEETNGQTMLPTSFLREIIAMYGNQMQAMLPSYLEASMAAFRRNQEQFAKTMMGGNAFGALAQQNLKMFEAAFSGGKNETQDAEPEAGRPDEIAELKAELAAMKEKLDRIG